MNNRRHESESNKGESHVTRATKASPARSISGTGAGLGLLSIVRLFALGSLGLLMLLGGNAPLASAAEPSEACSNGILRQQSNVNPTTEQPYSAGLPECRAYEMVSPLEKQAHDFGLFSTQSLQGSVAPSGNAVGITSAGSFEDPKQATNLDAGNGTPYLATRTPSGWTVTGAFAPAGIVPGVGQSVNGAVFSGDVRQVASCASVNESVLTARLNGFGWDCALRGLDGIWTPTPVFPIVGVNGIAGAGMVGASSDLSHQVFVTNGAKLLSSDTANGAASYSSPYEIVGVGTDHPELRLVNVDGNGNALGGGAFGIGGGQNGTGILSESYHAISDDGNTIYFNATPTGGVQTIYARLNGATTVTVSNPSPSECVTCSPTPAAATYQGASADGSKAFFTTTQQLVNADTDSTNDVYEYDFDKFPTHHIIQVSGGGAGDFTPGSGANVQGVVSTSRDGSHVYFVAKGLLTGVPNALGQTASSGANNLYSFDTETGQTKFVAVLAAGDSALWLNAVALGSTGRLGGAQETPDGRYLIFNTTQSLASDDTDGGAGDVYRYDSTAGALIRISTGEASFPGSNNGNTPNLNATIPPRQDQYPDDNADNAARAISDDGDSIIFTTPEQLQADDVNGAGAVPTCPTGTGQNLDMTGCDVYLWHAGAVSMVSDGHDPLGADSKIVSGTGFSGFGVKVSQPGISASGSDVFFLTHTRLVGQDTDPLNDVYDARVDGGFPYAAATTCVDSEGCQGAPAQLAPVDVPAGSATFRGPGNEATPPPAKRHLKKKRHKSRKHHVRKHATRRNG